MKIHLTLTGKQLGCFWSRTVRFLCSMDEIKILITQILQGLSSPIVGNEASPHGGFPAFGKRSMATSTHGIPAARGQVAAL